MTHSGHGGTLIVGDGIAGLILALFLGRAGVPHRILVRKPEEHPLDVAETLPPSSLALLEREDVLDLFERHAIKSFGYQALWSGRQLVDVNFFGQPPRGHGLKLRKWRLTQALREQCVDHTLSIERLTGVREVPGGMEVAWIRGGRRETAQASLVVDATGRKRAVLKRLGVGSVERDGQVASSCQVSRVRLPVLRYGVFTERFEGGWGIASAVDAATSAITLFAERGTGVATAMRRLDSWPRVLSGTHVLRRLLGSEPSGATRGAQANSSRALRIHGAGWLAVGDAAIAVDPLSSHGISNAVFSASIAARAVTNYYASGNAGIFAGYAQRMSAIFDAYLVERARYYAAAP